MSKPKLTINQETCIVCGNCVAAYAHLFEFSDDGKVQVKKGADFSKEDLEAIISLCPSAAINKEGDKEEKRK